MSVVGNPRRHAGPGLRSDRGFTWLEQMKKLSELAGGKLPKGSGEKKKKKATSLYQQLGEARMKEFCKLHFKTAYEAMGKTPPSKPKWNSNWRKG